MGGAGTVERSVHDWVVEWGEPDVAPAAEPGVDPDLADLVRRPVRPLDRGRAVEAEPAVGEASIAGEAWMIGEPLS